MRCALLFLAASGLFAAEVDWVFEASGWGGDHGLDKPFSYLNVETGGILPGQGEGIAHVNVELSFYADYLYDGQIHALFNGVELFAVGGGKHSHDFYVPVELGAPFTLDAFSAGYFGGRATPYGVSDAFVYSQAIFKVAVVGAEQSLSMSRFTSFDDQSPVPEPSTYLLSGLGFLGLVFKRMRRRPRWGAFFSTSAVATQLPVRSVGRSLSAAGRDQEKRTYEESH